MNEHLQNEQLLGNQRPSDDKMSMAIMNLQAMINIDDIDKIIQLLEQNNWDEG